LTGKPHFSAESQAAVFRLSRLIAATMKSIGFEPFNAALLALRTRT